MTSFRLTLLAAAASLTLSAPAFADDGHNSTNKMQTVCKSNFCVYDAGGHILGLLRDVGSFWRLINGKLYFSGYTAAGVAPDMRVFYLASNCTGQAYIASGIINSDNVTVTPEGPPLFAQWDGTSFWGPIGPSQIISTPISSLCVSYGCGGTSPSELTCQPSTGDPPGTAYAPAGIIETPVITKTAGCAAAQTCISVK